MAGRRAIKNFKQMTRNDFKNLSKRDAKRLLKEMRQESLKQIEKLDKAAERSDKFYSPAGEAMKTYYENKKIDDKLTSPFRMKNDDVVSELMRTQQFMNSKTFSVTESQKIRKATDMRIYGPSEKDPSQPAYRTSREDSELLWAAYNEFKNAVDTSTIFHLKYNQIQSELGKMIAEKRKKRQDITIAGLVQELKYRLSEDDYEYSELSEFSADWDDYDE